MLSCKVEHSNECLLNSLPPEVRLMVYERLFSSLPAVDLDHFQEDEQWPEPAIAKIPELRNEVLATWSSLVEWRITKKFGMRNFGLEYGLDRLNQYVHCIRHLRIELGHDTVIDIKLSGRG